MFVKTIFGSTLFAVANAIAINTNKTTEASAPYTLLAQTQAQVENSCCCHYMPCMPTCQEPCEPEVVEIVPEPMRDIVLNLDVILTHILHEVEEEHPEVVIPPMPPIENDGKDDTLTPEQRLIQTVISPIVLNLITNDVAPAIPTCTLEGEPYPYPGADALENATTETQELADGDEILEQILNDVAGSLTLPEGVDVDNLIEEVLASDDVVQTLNMDTTNGIDSQAIVDLVDNLVVFTEEFVNGVEVAGGEETPVDEFSSMVHEALEEQGLKADEEAVTEVVEEAIEPVEEAVEVVADDIVAAAAEAGLVIEDPSAVTDVVEEAVSDE